YAKMPNVELAALCDVDESILEKRLKDAEGLTGKRPAAFTDLRKLLEDKSIDAISIATPNHSHALQAIWGCQAGKDVYVEKPCAHNIFEAQQLLAAAKKYNQMDAARWLLGVKYPSKISATGGHFMFDDDQETPNTMVASFEFDEGARKMLVFEVRHWISNSEADIVSIADKMSGPAAGTHATVGNIVYGSNGYLSSAHGYETFLGKQQQPGPKGESEERGNNWAN